MEPLSIWAFTVIAAALGIGLSVTGKNKKDKAPKAEATPEVKSAPLVKSSRPVQTEQTTEVFDADKEKAIDDLIAGKN
ncbi:MAG: hypothetical protein WCO69_00495 [Candidatus Omnitrophota bacterium]